MSRSPKGRSEPVNSPRKTWRRRASTAPRVWMPTTAKRSESGFFSAISWAIRRSVRLRSSCSSTTFSLILRWLPSWPHGTGLKDALTVAARAAGRGRSSPAQKLGRLGEDLPRPAVVTGSVRDELGFSALGQRDYDLVEVARGDD